MSWTLTLYVARRFLSMLGAAFVVVFVMVLIVSLIELLRRSGEVDVPFPRLVGLALLQTPAIALTALPFTVMIATLACYARLARSSELVVIRAAGVSVWALVAAPAALAVALGVLSFSLLNPVAAATSARYETVASRLLKGQASRLSISREGLWLRQGAGEGQTVVQARGANGAATVLYNVTVHRFGDDDVLTGRIDAARATLGDGYWLLQDGTARRVEPAADTLDAVIAAEPFEELRLPTELTGAQIMDSFAAPEQISFWSLPGFIRTLESAGISAQRHRAHWHGQLAAPLLFAAMAMIGAGFSMRPARLGGLGLMALGAVMTAFGLYFLSDVAKALGASGAIPAALAAWGPAAAAALFGAGLLLRREDG
jgi:lipopolysaccharide export system permease protein